MLPIVPLVSYANDLVKDEMKCETYVEHFAGKKIGNDKL